MCLWACASACANACVHGCVHACTRLIKYAHAFRTRHLRNQHARENKRVTGQPCLLSGATGATGRATGNREWHMEPPTGSATGQSNVVPGPTEQPGVVPGATGATGRATGQPAAEPPGTEAGFLNIRHARLRAMHRTHGIFISSATQMLKPKTQYCCKRVTHAPSNLTRAAGR